MVAGRKGIALALGQAGATVYVTGRSRSSADSPYGGSVAETAALIDEAGGTGIPVPLDHADDEAVAELSLRYEMGGPPEPHFSLR
jgi:NAD(P)-dependent dehydrogenase (short-subunit alcohol dehydrogenase family)